MLVVSDNNVKHRLTSGSGLAGWRGISDGGRVGASPHVRRRAGEGSADQRWAAGAAGGGHEPATGVPDAGQGEGRGDPVDPVGVAAKGSPEF